MRSRRPTTNQNHSLQRQKGWERKTEYFFSGTNSPERNSLKITDEIDQCLKTFHSHNLSPCKSQRKEPNSFKITCSKFMTGYIDRLKRERKRQNKKKNQVNPRKWIFDNQSQSPQHVLILEKVKPQQPQLSPEHLSQIARISQAMRDIRSSNLRKRHSCCPPNKTDLPSLKKSLSPSKFEHPPILKPISSASTKEIEHFINIQPWQQLQNNGEDIELLVKSCFQ